MGIYTDEYSAGDINQPTAFFKRELEIMTLAERMLVRGFEPICTRHLVSISNHLDRFTSHELEELMDLLVQICQKFHIPEHLDRVGEAYGRWTAHIVNGEVPDETLRGCPGKLKHCECADYPY